MREAISRVRAAVIDRRSLPSDDATVGIVVLRVRPMSCVDYDRLLALVEESGKNDSWIEIGGGAGTEHAGIRIREVPAPPSTGNAPFIPARLPANGCTCGKPWHAVIPPPPCPIHGPVVGLKATY